MTKVPLAQLLLRRKQLQEKVDQLKEVSEKSWCELLVRRIKVTDGIDEVTASVPRAPVKELTKEYDYYARQLRLVDATIQRTNWETEVSVEPELLNDFSK